MANTGFFPYSPSVPAAALVAALFSLMYIAMLALSIAKRTTFFYCMIIGMTIELIGLAARVYAATHLDDMWSYLIWYLFVILAPSFMAAAVYQTFTRLVWTVTPTDKLNFRTLFVPPRFITPIFVLFDLIAFLIQLWGVLVVGGAYTASENDPSKIDINKVQAGSRILKAGLLVQLACFALFALIGIKFAVASRQWSTPVERKGKLLGSWHRLNWAINISATFIMARAIYRIFEFADPTSKDSVFNFEWAYWVLDTLPIIIAVGVFLVWHPGHYLPREHSRFLLKKTQLLHNRRSAQLNNEKFGIAGEAGVMSETAQFESEQLPPYRPNYSRPMTPPSGPRIAARRSLSPTSSRRARPQLQVNTTLRPNMGTAYNSNTRFPVNPTHPPAGDLGLYQQAQPRSFV